MHARPRRDDWEFVRAGDDAATILLNETSSGRLFLLFVFDDLAATVTTEFNFKLLESIKFINNAHEAKRNSGDTFCIMS